MSLWSRIRNAVRSDRLERELDAEVGSHLEEATERGRDFSEARRAFGSSLRTREESRDLKVIPWLDSLRADVVFGWRQLRKRKVTSAAAIVSLALAIGACTTAFRLVDALLFRPLPIAAAERLYVIAREGRGPDGNQRVSESSEYPLFREMRVAVGDRADLIAVSYSDRTDLTYGSDLEMEKASRQYLSGVMFDSFGLRPALGRLFTNEDDRTVGASPLVVLSYDYWASRFGRDARVAGRTLRIGNTLFEIIGVAPERFTGTEPGVGVDIFIPASMHPGVNTGNSWFRALAHLRDGADANAVRDLLRVPFQAVGAEQPKTPDQTLLLLPASAGTSNLQKDYRLALIALSVLVALVLLVACANVANLMTAQAASRSREMALRVSIGAGRARLVQLVLAESCIVALLASAAGGALAWWAAPFVVSLISTADHPARLFLPFDWRVMVFALALTLFVVFVFGLAPALRASGVRPSSALKGGEEPHSRRRLMHALIAVQVAFCFVILFVAGLFAATFDRLAHQAMGFSAERLLSVDAVSRSPQGPELWEQVRERLKSVPGVETVALARWPLLDGNGLNGSIVVDGATAPGELAYFLGVSPGWLETMKIPLLDGRDLRTTDLNPGAAIVNQAFVKRYFSGQNAVGRVFEKEVAQGVRPRFVIVGVAGDARYRDMREPIKPTAYVPLRDQSVDRCSFIVRTSAQNPLSLSSILRQEVPRARSEFRVSNIRSETQLIERHTLRERLLAMLALFFAGVTLVLAGIGLYGVLDYSVLQRRREIGIRMSIGAQASDIGRSVVADAFRMVVLGSAIGVGAGLLSARYVATLLYQVKGNDITMLAVPGAAILAIACLAALPAVVRAVRIDPVSMLRSE